MKKFLSSLLAFAMVLALFSGVVVFNVSAATEVQMHIPFINQYSLEQVQKYQMCYNGYLSADKNASNVSFSKDAFDRVVVTATTSAATGGHAGDSYNHIYLSTAQTATIRAVSTLIDDINPFGNAELSNKSALYFKVAGDEAFYNALGSKNANIILASSKYKTFITGAAGISGKSASSYYYIFKLDLSSLAYTSSQNTTIKSLPEAYDGLIDTMIIDFRFANAATPTEVKFWIEDFYVTAGADTTTLISAIRNAKNAGVDQSLIDAAEAVYKNTASTQAEVDAAVASLGAYNRIQLPFINQYTLAQAQRMGTRYSWGNDTNNGRNYSFAKDDQGRTVVNFTTGTTLDTYGGVSAYLSTGTQGNFYYANPLIDGINVFDGAELSNKSVIAFKWGGDDNFNNVVKSINLVLKNSSKKILLELKNGVKNAEGYYEYRLSGMTFNNSTGYNELGIKTIGETYDGIIDGLVFVFRANAVDTPVSCWLEDAYVVGSADTRELLSEIRKAKTEGVLPAELIEEAEKVYKDQGSLQSQVDAAVDMLKKGFSAYDYYPLTGFTKTTQTELDTLSGNVGYVDETIYNSVSSKLELTENAGEVKLTTIPANNQKYNQSIVTYVKTNGATLADNPWTPLDTTVDMSTMDGIRFKLTDSDGKPVSYYGQYRFIVQASGWGNYWYYRGQPELDDDGYNVIDFDRLFRYSTTNTEMTFSHEVVKLDGISFLMYNADTTLYFSDLQAYKRNVPRSYGMEFVTLPGFQDWTQTNVDAHNIADLQTAQSSIGIDKTAAALRGTATQGVRPINPKATDPAVYYPNQWSHVISTQTNADKTVQQQNGDVFGSYKKLGEMLKWDGIRIGFSKSDGGAPVPYSWDSSKHVQVKLTLVGSGQKSFSNEWYRNYAANYSCGSSTAYGTDMGDLTFSNYDEGYLYFYFNDFKDGWADKTLLEGNKDHDYGNFILLVQGGGMNDQWRRYIYSDIQLFRKIVPADKTALGEAIAKLEAIDAAAYAAELTAAKEVYNADAPSQDDVDAQTAIITECIKKAIIGNLWQYNYTAESWAPLAAAAEALDAEAAATAKAALVPYVTVPTTGNMMQGWTTENVNAVVTANSGKLGDYIKGGNCDFTNNTVFEANDNLALTAGVAFDADKAMGWKNMDRSGTLAAGGANYGYPVLNVAGLKDAEGIRFKIDVNEGGSFDHLVVGLSNCASMVKEQYASINFTDGYVNVPWSAFEKASWGQAFTLNDIEQAVVFLVEVYGAANGTKVTISDLKGYRARTEADDIADVTANLWQYNYTPESWTALQTAIAGGSLTAVQTAIEALVPANVKTVTENFFKGWTTDDVNAVVTANADAQLKDYVGNGLNTNWNAGDFSKNTTFAADDNFSMTATAAFTNVTMGWKNLDRSATLNPDKNPANAGADYPFMAANVKGLSKAEGVRFKLESNKPVERILIGLSNCNTMVREMYAMNVKPEYVGADGYINLPFTCFEKAFWCDAFAQSELEDVIVFIIEALGVEEGTTITVSDFRGYKTIVAPTQADLDNLDAVLAKLAAFDYENRYAELAAEAAAAKTSADQDDVLDAIAAVKAVTDKADAADRSALKANIDAVKAIDEELWANELAAGVEAYYNLDATQAVIDAAAKVLKRIIDKPETPVVTASEVTDTSITVTPIEGAKYKLNDGEWQDSNVFEGLLPNKAYAVSAYIAETDDHIASDVSVAVEVTTAKGSFGTASVTLSGVERYTEVLTATVTDVPEYLGGYTIEWRNEAGETVGTGETYTIAAADIGSFVYAVLVSDNAADTVASDPTGTIGKGIIKNPVIPTASAIQYPQLIGDSVLSGGDTGEVTGVWSWVTPDVQPLSSQSGSAYDVIFTPSAAYIDLFEIIEARVVVIVNPAPYEPTTFEDKDTNTDLTVTGEFMQNVEMHVADISFKDPAYIALLRASGKDNSGLTKLVLFKTFSFTVNGEEIDDVYEGELTVSSYVGIARAGQIVSAWFFIGDKPVNYVGTVDAEGVLHVEGVTL